MLTLTLRSKRREVARDRVPVVVDVRAAVEAGVQLDEGGEVLAAARTARSRCRRRR